MHHSFPFEEVHMLPHKDLLFSMLSCLHHTCHVPLECFLSLVGEGMGKSEELLEENEWDDSHQQEMDGDGAHVEGEACGNKSYVATYTTNNIHSVVQDYDPYWGWANVSGKVRLN
jgi:hypothetical protein